MTSRSNLRFNRIKPTSTRSVSPISESKSCDAGCVTFTFSQSTPCSWVINGHFGWEKAQQTHWEMKLLDKYGFIPVNLTSGGQTSKVRKYFWLCFSNVSNNSGLRLLLSEWILVGSGSNLHVWTLWGLCFQQTCWLVHRGRGLNSWGWVMWSRHFAQFV